VRVTKNHTCIRPDGVKISLSNGDAEIVKEILPDRIIFKSGQEMALTNQVNRNGNARTPGLRRASPKAIIKNWEWTPKRPYWEKGTGARVYSKSGSVTIQPREKRPEEEPQYQSCFGFHATHNYVITSQGSQSWTEDRSLGDLGRSTFPAVTETVMKMIASRARYSATFYTDSIPELREAIMRSDARPSALDIFSSRDREAEKAKGQKDKLFPPKKKCRLALFLNQFHPETMSAGPTKRGSVLYPGAAVLRRGPKNTSDNGFFRMY
jgi:hypothetical protein